MIILILQKLVIDKIQLQQADRGILICGTGMGMCITANRLSSIRAACCYDKEQTIIARQHNNINVLCLGRVLQRPNSFRMLQSISRNRF